MSRSGDAGTTFLADADLFFYFLRGGKHEKRAADVIARAAEGSLSLRTSSEVYDDAISAIRSEGQPLEVAEEFVSAMRSIPHSPAPMTGQLAADALSLYIQFGGRGRLSYFDSFHVATAKSLGLTMLTSDAYINRNASKLGVRTADLSNWDGKVPAPKTEEPGTQGL